MRRLLILSLAAGGLIHCEQQYSATPPPLQPGSLAPASASGGIEALLSPAVTDAGSAAVSSFHALTITLCSSSPQACPPPEGDSPSAAVYRVVYGSGRGVTRTREQALTDLYKELRDRTGAGDRLVAQPHVPGDGGAPNLGGSSTKATTNGSDALADSAQRLLDIVDGVGEVTVDVAHGTGAPECVLSLGRSIAGGGSWQCLIKEPHREQYKSRGGMSF
jgi:hypothetical protein